MTCPRKLSIPHTTVDEYALIAFPSNLQPRERAALAALLRRLQRADMPPVRLVLLFGSKARGDDDAHSDLDVLVVCAVPARQRKSAARAVHRATGAVARHFGVELESWTVPVSALRRGRRTPMLVDAFADALPLWPPGLRAVRLPYTPADARFGAERLLEWWMDGGAYVRRALQDGRRARAAARLRDDITRLATAALLLTGDTRHRRRSSLRRFHDHFVRGGIVTDAVTPALRWADAAYPADGGRGAATPRPTPTSMHSVEQAYEWAGVFEREVLPWIERALR